MVQNQCLFYYNTVPLYILHGLITSLHLQLSHPTATQLINRSYFSLNANDCVNHVLQACSQCQALKTIPRELIEQTSTPQTTTLATNFAADILRRYGQKIFVMRDTLSSFTITSFVKDETHDSLRSAIIEAVSNMRANPQTTVTIRADNAPGLATLKNDHMLQTFNIILDYGRIHNKNKNPVVEKAILELGGEMLRYSSKGGPFSSSELAYITNVLNSRLRHHGLSAWEILYRRDQFSGEQIDVNILDLAEQQQHLRAANQHYSAKSKARGRPPATAANVKPGSLVYVKGEGDKTKSRERYIVIDILGDSCTLRKLSKSQLRSKSYQLKLSEIYPVLSELPAEYPSPADDSDTDSDILEDNVTVGSSNQTAGIDLPITNDNSDSLPPVDDAHVEAGIDGSIDHADTPSEVDQNVNQEAVMSEDLDATIAYDFDEGLPSDVGSDARRSSRKSVKPSWMRSGDFVIPQGKKR